VRLFYVSCFFGTVFSFIKKRKNFLMCLLSMEGAILCGVLFLLITVQAFHHMLVVVPLLVFVVVEAAFGLRVLVGMARSSRREIVSF